MCYYEVKFFFWPEIDTIEEMKTLIVYIVLNQ